MKNRDKVSRKIYYGVKQAMCTFNYVDVLFRFFPILVSGVKVSVNRKLKPTLL